MLNLHDIIEWDIPNWSVALEYWKKHTAQDLATSSAMEIGSMHGGLSLWAAMNGMNVLCTDLEGPSSKAIEKHAKYGLSHLIKYDALNALSIPYSAQFNVVLFKSVLGGIGRLNNRDNQEKAIREMHKSLKNGGEIWFAENLVASPMHALLRRRYVEWGKNWRYVTIEEMEHFFALFSDFRYTTVGFLGALGRSPLQRTILGKLDRAIADKLVPDSWRYIIIGIAKK